MANPRSYIDKARTIHPDLPTVLTPMFTRIEGLETAAAAIGTVTEPLTQHLDANSMKVQNLAAPTESGDAVNLETLRQYVAAALKQKGL